MLRLNNANYTLHNCCYDTTFDPQRHFSYPLHKHFLCPSPVKTFDSVAFFENDVRSMLNMWQKYLNEQKYILFINRKPPGVVGSRQEYTPVVYCVCVWGGVGGGGVVPVGVLLLNEEEGVIGGVTGGVRLPLVCRGGVDTLLRDRLDRDSFG